MTLHFITHSSFLLETETADFLFDYFEGNLPQRTADKPLFVLASHSHPDHFSTKIFQIVENNAPVQFVLSDDIPAHIVPLKYRHCTHFIAPAQTLRIENTVISALKSTDLGVAFMVEHGGKTIYHAGDLNAWVWPAASPSQNREMLRLYTQEITKLKSRQIDVAFVTLDPRQDEGFSVAMQVFLEEIDPQIAVPMHMWGDFSVVPRFFKKFPQYADKLLKIERDGQAFTLS